MRRAQPPREGDFIRLHHLWGRDLPAPVWAVVTKRYGAEHPDLDLDVEVFCGQEIVDLHIGIGNSFKSVPVDEGDGFRVYSIGTLPNYALVALAKYQLLKGT